METGKANIDGINLSYVRQGRGAPLVLIHGYPLDHTIWDEVSQQLENEFDMIIPDLRGFGESEVIEADHSIIDYASDVAGLLDRFRIKKAIIAGHSMGGYVALAFAREFPERVAGFALVASQLLPDAPERKAGRYASARQVMSEGVGTVVESMVPKLSAVPEVQARLRPLISRQQPLAFSCALQAMAERPDATEIFRSFRFPVVVVHGEADALVPVDRGRAMKALLPSAHYVELAGVGHMPMIEDPGAVAEALRFFKAVKLKNVKILNT